MNRSRKSSVSSDNLDNLIPDENPVINETGESNLGKILITICAQHNELCKKLQIADPKISIDQIIRDYGNVRDKEIELADNLTKQNIEISQLSENIQDQILSKEMGFANFNAAIKIPDYFSPTPTLTTPVKQAEAIKIFNLKRPFSGNENIFEFLSKMNYSQSICKLSEKEFIQMIHSQTTRDCHSLLSDLIESNHCIKDIYYTLVSLYDNRQTPQAAQFELNKIRSKRGEHVVKLTSRIMKLVSRVAAQFPAGPSRSEFYNVECLNALTKSLPLTSKNLVRNNYNSLVLKLGKSPQFIELLKILRPFFDSINNDINTNANSDHRENNFERRGRFPEFNGNRNFKIRYLNSKNNNVKNNSREKERFNPPTKTFKKSPSNKRPHMEARNGRDERTRRTKWCSLCGRTDHFASDICYSMKNSDGRVIKVMPTYDPCQKCLDKTGKKLYHPQEYCIIREDRPRRNQRRD